MKKKNSDQFNKFYKDYKIQSRAHMDSWTYQMFYVYMLHYLTINMVLTLSVSVETSFCADNFQFIFCACAVNWFSINYVKLWLAFIWKYFFSKYHHTCCIGWWQEFVYSPIWNARAFDTNTVFTSAIVGARVYGSEKGNPV